MNRLIALVCAVLLAMLTVSTACAAAPGAWIGASFTPAAGKAANPGTAKVGSRSSEEATAIMPSELIGFELSGFRFSGTRPLRFAVA